MRRRAALSEFTFADTVQTRLMHETIDAFIAARLLTTNKVGGTTTLEVSHEAVIREWRRLWDWLCEARADIHFQQSLSEDVVEWERHQRSRSRLYRGAHLKEAQVWASRNKPSEQEATFLQASTTQQTLSRVGQITMIVLLVFALLSSIGVGLWALKHQPPNPTLVTTLQDGIDGSLRYCIEHASSGSTIRFAPYLFASYPFAPNLKRGTIDLTEGSLVFPSGKTLTIAGPGVDQLRITGGNRNAIIHVSKGVTLDISGLSFKDSQTIDDAFLYNEGTLTVNNSVISNNTTTSDTISRGGGIRNLGTLTISNSLLANNVASGSGSTIGGGIDNTGNLTVVHSTFLKNIARSSRGSPALGGGIANYSAGMVKVEAITFFDNSASGDKNGQGGGIDNDGKLTVVHSTFLQNTASGKNHSTAFGGGIVNNGTGTVTVEASTFSDNSAHGDKGSQGGGIDNEGKLTVVNSTFLKNSVLTENGSMTGRGGSIYNTRTAIIRFATLYDNTSGAGGGIWNTSTNSRVTMSNTIVAENRAQDSPDIAGVLTSDGYNLIENITGSYGLSSTDKQIAFADLKLDHVLRNNGGLTQTLRLLPGSPALDAIPGNRCSITIVDVSGHTESITTDQRDYPRLHTPKHACNIGAI
jgi:hypothetical protein